MSGSRFRLVTPALSEDDAVLHGDFRQVQLRPGLILHCTDTHELHDLKTEAVQRPGITISLFLKGGVTAWIGGRRFQMGPVLSYQADALRLPFRRRGRSRSRGSPREEPISAR